ncbi:MAG: phage major capsid protein [Gammaproteobacteria bacterium]
MKIRELIEERTRVINQARGLIEKAESEKRNLSNEERAKHTELMAKQAEIKAEIESREHQEALDRELATRIAAETANENRGTQTRTPDELRMLGFRNWLRYGNEARDMEGVAEFRDFQADIGSTGGFLVPPMEFVNQIILKLKDLVWVRKYGTVHPVTNSQSLGVPTLNDEPSDADWTTELSTGSDDTQMDFGLRELSPHPIAKQIKVSKKLTRISAVPIDGLISDRFSYIFGITEEQAFLTGSGAQQPLGLFTASANGIDTSRDVSSGNTDTSIGFDGLFNAKYGLKQQYRAACQWLFSRSAINQVSTLKDNYGRYLWNQSQQSGQPDLLLGIPVLESEYVPATFTANEYVGLLGNLKYYWIADALDMEMQQLNELYAASNQVGFIMRKETDAMPVLAEAFVRVQLASS